MTDAAKAVEGNDRMNYDCQVCDEPVVYPPWEDGKTSRTSLCRHNVQPRFASRLTAVEEPAKSMTMVEIVHPTRQQIYERSLEIIHKLRPEGCFGDPDGLYGELEFYVRALNVSPAKVEEPAIAAEVAKEER